MEPRGEWREDLRAAHGLAILLNAQRAKDAPAVKLEDVLFQVNPQAGRRPTRSDEALRRFRDLAREAGDTHG